MTVTSHPVREQRASARGQATVIQAGGNVVVGGVFAGPFARLRDRWLDPGPIFRDVQVERFTGREWLVDQVDRFIGTHGHGHVIVQADAGLGKTALAAWLAWKRDWPCHFTRLSNGRSGLIALSNLGAQLIARYGLGDDFASQGVLGDTAGESGWFQHVLQAAADVARASGERVIIVVDGLDEAEPAAGALPLGLPVLLPPGTFIVATCRTGTDLPALRQPYQVIEIKAGSRRNAGDLTQYLRGAFTADVELATVLAAAGQVPDAVAAGLLARCGGVWIYLRYVLNELRAGERSVSDIDSLPGDLFSYYAESMLANHHDPDWGRLRLPLLATLAVAPEPLPVPVLTRLAGLPDEHPVQVLCGGRLLPFLTVSPPHEDGLLRYSVYHASLREFLSGTAPVPAAGGGRAQSEEFARAAAVAHSRIADTYLDAFGGLHQGLPTLAADPSAGQRDGGYALRHLTGHLERAGRHEDINALLAQEQPPPASGSVWYLAHEQAGTLAEYRSDLDRARRLAADRTDRNLRLGRLAPSLALELRYLMIDSAIRASVPVELIARLAGCGLWTPARALFYARQPVDLSSRATRLAALLPALPEDQQPAVAREALTLASQVASPYVRAWTCSVLADYLPEAEACEAAAQGLAAARAVMDDDDRARLLESLAEQVPAALLPDVAGLAHEIGDEDERVRALLALVPLVPESALPGMVTALAGVAGDYSRECLIRVIASRKPAALAGALAAAARTLHAENRAWTLGAIARMMAVPDAALAGEALAAARETADPAERAAALRELSGLIVARRQQLLDEALSTAGAADGQPRFSVTMSIAELLPAPRRRSVIGGLLSEALAEPAGPHRTWCLASLASYLTKAQLTQVIPVVLATEPEEDRAELLSAYAPFLHDQFFPLALQAAAALRDEHRRGQVIQELAPELPESLLGKALSVVGGISGADTRRSCIAALAERLPDGHLGQALGMVQSSASEGGAARFLHELAQGQDEPRRTELLQEALASARAAADGVLRAQALGDLAATLSVEQRDRILAEAGRATEGYEGYGAAYALDYLIRRSAGTMRKELITRAFARARAMSGTWWRPAWLASLARYVPRPDRAALLAEALSDARSLPSGEDRMGAFISIAVDFPGQERISAFREVIALAGDGTRPNTGTRLLIDFLKVLPDRLILRVLELLYRLESEDTRLPPFGWALKLIPDRKMDEGLAILRDYPAGAGMAHALGTAALYVPERVRSQVLSLALDATDRVTARRAILTQAQLLWPDRVTPAEMQTFRQVMADNGLDEYLCVLAEALAIIARAGGPQCLDDCLDAYRTIQRWWPPFTAQETLD